MRLKSDHHISSKTKILILYLFLGSFVSLPVHADEQKADPAVKAENKEANNTEVEKSDNEEHIPYYLDNRSTPETLIASYYNAINRKEYVRAYSYYSEEGRDPNYDVYAEGYINTKSVKVKTRQTEPDPGAGQIYWSVPLAIEAEDNDGKKTVFTGCYTLRMTNPAMQDVPPFKPLEIMTGSLTPSPLDLEKSVPESCEAP
ncbi:hypothetical protein ACLBWZ_14380 [Brucellaceae bacterium C25G]